MRRLLPIGVLGALLSMMVPVAVFSETPAVQEGPVRPDDVDGLALPSDGLAECAAILAVGSSVSNNIVERNRMTEASANWFAASGDLALQEGALPEDGVWEAKVIAWAGRIGSIDALARQPDWMAYCTSVGAPRGLDAQHFPAKAE